MDLPERRAPEPTDLARQLFGARLALAQQYADLLASTGISHGLIGPREAERLWDRHLVNCALMESLLPRGCRVIDIGSGAGLPGLVLAIVRPDLHLDLVEPLLRRTTWLDEAVQVLGLTNVTVHRDRAEDVDLRASVVTARAVASLDKLVTWSFPLLEDGGRLLALKGAAADDELKAAAPMLDRVGVTQSTLHLLGADEPEGPVRVVEIVRPSSVGNRDGRRSGVSRARAGGGSAAGRRRRRTR